MKRFDCLKSLVPMLSDEIVVISLGGQIDEWYHLRPSRKNMYIKGMGAVIPFTFGLSVALPHRKIICSDTDGSLLLNMGILATLGNENPNNLIVMIMDNECYETIAKHPTHTCKNVDLAEMARGAGIKNAFTVKTVSEFTDRMEKALKLNELSFIVLKLEPGSQAFPEEERKRSDGIEDKYNFVRYLEDSENITIFPREVKSIRKIEAKHNWNNTKL
jgi:thiamine pyrophosphate-dependent acetolactate synthase large subunit-like protein